MPHTNPITETYEPADHLRELLAEVESDARVHYEAEQSFQISGGHEATQLSYTVTFDEFELTGTETVTPVGVLVSLDGHLGCATSMILTNSLAYGEPTHAYIDEGNSAGTQYRDLTAEWYVKSAVESGAAKARLKNKVVDFDANPISLKKMEEWAQVWLEAGD